MLDNEIVGGAGKRHHLGGDLDRRPTDRVDLPVLLRPAVNVDASGQFRFRWQQDETGNRCPTSTSPRCSATLVPADRTDGDGLASVKTAPGRYTLDVAPKHDIVRVAETRPGRARQRDHGRVPRPPASIGKSQAFLHEITIADNKVSQMPLLGIGFRRCAMARARWRQRQPAGQRRKAALLAFVDAGLRQLAMTLLLRATHPVRDP